MSFPDPGPMPPPVLQLTDVSFGYPGSKQLYKNLNFGLDLDSRITLVGPNGQGEGGGGVGGVTHGRVQGGGGSPIAV